MGVQKPFVAGLAEGGGPRVIGVPSGPVSRVTPQPAPGGCRPLSSSEQPGGWGQPGASETLAKQEGETVRGCRGQGIRPTSPCSPPRRLHPRAHPSRYAGFLVSCLQDQEVSHHPLHLYT